MSLKNYAFSLTFRAFDRVTAPMGKMSSALRTFSARTARMGNLSSALVGGGLSNRVAGIATGAINMAAKFERYNAVLKNTLGSQEAASAAMANIQTFAAKTPFAVDELTASYIKFENRGIKPTMEMMTQFGDIASSQGKSFDQFTEALLDGVSGEFERLKEFGIRASKSGDQVTLAFKDVEKTVQNTPEAIQAALESFGNIEGVKGGMLAISRTWEGMVSNIGDSADMLQVALGQRLIAALRPLGLTFGETLSNAAEFFGHAEHGAARVEAALWVLAPFIGTVFVAAVLSAGMAIVNSLLPAFQLMWTMTVGTVKSIGWLISALFGERAAILSNVAARKASMLSRNMSLALGVAEKSSLTIGAVLHGVLTGKISAATAAHWAFNTAIAANPIGLTILVIAAAVAAIAGLIIYWDEFVAIMSGLGDWLMQAWRFVMTIPPRLAAQWGELPGWAQTILSVFGPLAAIPLFIYRNWETVSSIPGKITGSWTSLIGWLQGLYVSLKAYLLNAADSIFEKWSWLTGIPRRILAAWSSLPGWAQAIITLLAPFIGLPLLIAENWQKVVGVVQGAIGILKSAGSLLGFGPGGEGGGSGPRALPTGAAAAPQVFNSNSTKVERSEVKVSFDQLPAGARVQQDRPAKGTEFEYTGLALGGAL